MVPAKPRPRLPQPLSFPLGLVPERVQSLVVAQTLNRVFARERADGELDFLEDKRMRIRVDDAGSTFSISLNSLTSILFIRVILSSIQIKLAER